MSPHEYPDILSVMQIYNNSHEIHKCTRPFQIIHLFKCDGTLGMCCTISRLWIINAIFSG